MKIVISESQYHNLFESNYEKNLTLVYKMWNEGMDIYDINELTGLTLEQILFLLKDKKIKIDCGFAYNLLRILFRSDLVNKKHTFEDMSADLEFSWDGFGGIVNFSYNDNRYKLRGFSTPYWDGNCVTPVDGSDFEDMETGNYDEYYDNQGMTTEYTPSRFNSIQELIDFLNNEYPKLVMEPIQKLIKFYRGK